MGRTIPSKPRKDMSTIINNIDMEDTDELRRKLQRIMDRQHQATQDARMGHHRKTEGYRGTSYDDRTTCQVNMPSRSPYDPATETNQVGQSHSEVKLTRENLNLTEENKKLTRQYADLLEKTTRIVTAYKELQKENESLNKKKVKREVVTKSFAAVGKSGKEIWNSIVLWLKS